MSMNLLFRLGMTVAPIVLLLTVQCGKPKPAASVYPSIRQHDAQKAAAALQAGADVEERTPFGKTPLMVAIDSGCYDIARLLLRHKADVNAVDDSGWTALLTAGRRADSAGFVAQLLEAGADVHPAERRGNATALVFVVKMKNIDLVRKVLDRGANVNCTYTDKWTPLFASIIQQTPDITRLLLERGADVNSQNDFGWSVLMEAVSAGDPLLVEELLRRNAAINVTNGQGWTALLVALQERKYEIATLLLNRGADPRPHDVDGNCALSMCLATQNYEVLQRLISHGADVNERHDKNGTTPLIMAAARGDARAAEMLLAAGANGALKDAQGKTAADRALTAGTRQLLTR